MKRRKAMHYLRQMIKNPAIAYILAYLEDSTECISVYNKRICRVRNR